MSRHSIPDREPDVFFEETSDNLASISLWIINDSFNIITALYRSSVHREDGVSELKYAENKLYYRNHVEDEYELIENEERTQQRVKHIVEFFANYKKQLEEILIGDENDT